MAIYLNNQQRDALTILVSFCELIFLDDLISCNMNFSLHLLHLLSMALKLRPLLGKA